jgi:membrane fusion protein
MSDLFRREAVQYAGTRLNGAVVLASPLSLKTLGLLLAATVFAAVGFAATTSYARKATVPGYIVPDQGMIRATTQAAGTLQSVVVQQGDRVKAGDRIAVLGLAAETAAGNVGEAISQSLRTERAAAESKAKARLAQLEVERQQSTIRLSKVEAELRQVVAQSRLQEQRVEIANDEVRRGQQVASKGFLSERELSNRRTAALGMEQELAAMLRSQATIERDIADISARLASIPFEIALAVSEAQAASAGLEQRSAEFEAKRLQFITAPVGGRVAALPVANGQAIAPGGTVAVIIPDDSRLEAELLAPSRAIGFVRPDQQVALSLQAFPYQRYGTVPGIVRTVSTTVLAPTEVGFPGLELKEPVFRIRVSLSREAMHAYGQAIPIQSGMLVSADIVFDRRSLLQWVFDPVYAVGLHR